MTHAMKEENLSIHGAKKQPAENVPKVTQMLDLRDKQFKSITLNTCKELLKLCLKN